MSSSSMKTAVHTSASVHRWRDDVPEASAICPPWIVAAVGGLRGSATWCSQRPERGAKLGRKQFGLLPGREVATSLRFVEVDEGRVGVLGPAARCPPDLAR